VSPANALRKQITIGPLKISSVIRKSAEEKMKIGPRTLPATSAGNAEALGEAGSRGRAAPEAEVLCYSMCLALRSPEVPNRAPPKFEYL